MLPVTKPTAVTISISNIFLIVDADWSSHVPTSGKQLRVECRGGSDTEKDGQRTTKSQLFITANLSNGFGWKQQPQQNKKSCENEMKSASKIHIGHKHIICVTQTAPPGLA